MSNQQDFLDYLKGLGDSTPKHVCEFAYELYGVEAWLNEAHEISKEIRRPAADR
jgi:hypothetical protein